MHKAVLPEGTVGWIGLIEFSDRQMIGRTRFGIIYMLNSTFLCTNGLKIPSSSSKKYNTWSKCYWYPLLILLRKKYISFHWWYRTLVHTLLIIAYQLLKNLAVAGPRDVIKIWLIYQDRQKFSCIYVVNWCVPCVETGVFPLVLSVYIVILDPLEHILLCFRKMTFDRSSPLKPTFTHKIVVFVKY